MIIIKNFFLQNLQILDYYWKVTCKKIIEIRISVRSRFLFLDLYNGCVNNLGNDYDDDDDGPLVKCWSFVINDDDIRITHHYHSNLKKVAIILWLIVMISDGCGQFFFVLPGHTHTHTHIWMQHTEIRYVKVSLD